MNLRLEVALNDVTGKSGRAIIEAILSGERNPGTLAGLADYRVKKSKEEIALSLEGNWHEGYLFVLAQHYNEYVQNLDRIKACENTVLSIITEIGTDITKFHSADAFSNWLHLCPNQKSNGRKSYKQPYKKGY